MIDEAVEAYYTNGHNDLTDMLDFEINGNQMVLKYPDIGDTNPYVKLLVRYENVYTRVSLDFK